MASTLKSRNIFGSPFAKPPEVDTDEKSAVIAKAVFDSLKDKLPELATQLVEPRLRDAERQTTILVSETLRKELDSQRKLLEDKLEENNLMVSKALQDVSSNLKSELPISTKSFVEPRLKQIEQENAVLVGTVIRREMEHQEKALSTHVENSTKAVQELAGLLQTKQELFQAQLTAIQTDLSSEKEQTKSLVEAAENMWQKTVEEDRHQTKNLVVQTKDMLEQMVQTTQQGSVNALGELETRLDGKIELRLGELKSGMMTEILEVKKTVDVLYSRLMEEFARAREESTKHLELVIKSLPIPQVILPDHAIAVNVQQPVMPPPVHVSVPARRLVEKTFEYHANGMPYKVREEEIEEKIDAERVD